MKIVLSETPLENFIEVAGERFDQNPAAVYLVSLAPSSRRTMARALNVICGMSGIPNPNEGLAPNDPERVPDQRYLLLPWHKLEYKHAVAIRSKLEERYAHNTVNRILSALRQTLRAAWKMELITAEWYQKVASIENIEGSTLPAGRDVPMGEITSLLDTCDQSPMGIRDAAIIVLLYSCGLRREELVKLDTGDYDQATGAIRVLGKRNKKRLVYAVGSAADALADWLIVRGTEPGALFLGTGHNNQGNRLTTQAIYKMLQTRAKQAGVSKLSPHDMRRSWVGELLDRGADIATVQKMAGHASVETTARYDRRGEKVKRKAAGLIHIPYTRRALENKT